MRIIAVILDQPMIERILIHIGEPTAVPAVLSARAPRRWSWASSRSTKRPGSVMWPEIDQIDGNDTWD